MQFDCSHIVFFYLGVANHCFKLSNMKLDSLSLQHHTAAISNPNSRNKIINSLNSLMTD